MCNKYQRHSSLNLVSQQLKLCNIFIFGMVYSFTWSRYKYVEVRGVENEDGTPKKRLSNVQEKTPAGELITCLKQFIQEYPFHQFMACWQRDQFDNIKEPLPFIHVLCVHDFSENYQCNYQDTVTVFLQRRNLCSCNCALQTFKIRF